MTVRELIDTNQMITDVQITVRKDGTRLLDQLNIGCHEGIKPRFPTRVPKDEKYINNFSTLDSKMYKDAAYIPKSINAWDAARKIAVDVIDGGYSLDELREIFDETLDRIIFKRNTASEAIAKIKAYEDEQDAEIKVGDEVVFEDAHVVITYISPSNEWNGFLLNDCESGKRGHGYTLMKGFNGWRKTGRHFPQIAEVLKEMRGAENDE